MNKERKKKKGENWFLPFRLCEPAQRAAAESEGRCHSSTSPTAVSLSAPSTPTEPVLHPSSQPVMRQQRPEESDTQNPAKLPGEDMLNRGADKDRRCLSAHLDLH